MTSRQPPNDSAAYIDSGFFDLRNPSFVVALKFLDTVAKWTHYRALNSPAPCTFLTRFLECVRGRRPNRRTLPKPSRFVGANQLPL